MPMSLPAMPLKLSPSTPVGLTETIKPQLAVLPVLAALPVHPARRGGPGRVTPPWRPIP